MKKFYILVLATFLVSQFSVSLIFAQDGFESYDVGSRPTYMNDAGADGGGAVEVTTDDKWEGSKSLVLRDKTTTTSWMPYAIVDINFAEGLAITTFDVKIPESGWFSFWYRDANGGDALKITLYGTWSNVGQRNQGGAILDDNGNGMAFVTNSWCKVTLKVGVGTMYNGKFDLIVEELEGANPTTHTATGVDIVGGMVGSLANSKLIFSSDKDVQEADANIFIDELTWPVVATAIQSIKENSIKLTLFPNPNNGQLFINSIIKNNTVATLSISDVSGHIVLQDNQFRGSKSYNIANMTNGIYIVKISNGENYSTKKMILNK